MVFLSLGQTLTARRFIDRALLFGLKVLDPNNGDLATIFQKAGWILDAEGDWILAKVFMRQSVAISKRTLGDGHFKVANRLYSLALLEMVRGEPGAAREHLESALPILLGVYGLDSPSAANVGRDLARALAGSRQSTGPGPGQTGV